MKISKSRIPIVIGKEGETKNKIEKNLSVKINIDSKTGDCEILPVMDGPNHNPLNVFTAQKILNAINRGFNPNKAIKLLEEPYELEVFNLLTVLGKSDKRIKRMKGRIIGRNGEMRREIEKFADCFISVHGKTISIIADYENLQVARKAVKMILNGMPHHTVIKFLEDKYKEKQKEQFQKFYKPEF